MCIILKTTDEWQSGIRTCMAIYIYMYRSGRCLIFIIDSHNIPKQLCSTQDEQCGVFNGTKTIQFITEMYFPGLWCGVYFIS